MSMFYELMMRKKGMPKRYELVEYIQSDGYAYIDTGIIGTGNLTLDFKYQSAQNSSAIFGARVSYGNRDLSLFQVSGGGRFDYFGSHLSGLSLSANTINKVATKIENNDYIVNAYDENDVLLGTKSTTVINNTTSATIKLFGIDTNGTVSVNNNCIIYYFKIYDNNRLVRNFIPVYDIETQKYGMWETVQRKFYGNDGTGDFKGSIVGYTIVGSPTIVDGVVSGFSSANYLTLPQLNYGTIDKAEINISVIFDTSATQYRRFFGNNLGIRFDTLGGVSKIRVRVNSDTNILDFNYALNQKYQIKTIYENGVTKVWLNDSYVGEITETITYNYLLGLGCAMNGTSFGASGVYCSIYLNETYIKINNKLWFNGQQA